MKKNRLIDSVVYNENYSSLIIIINQEDGSSLENISYPSQDKNNWTAASTADFASLEQTIHTPGV
jgi:hypothetical protein